MSDLILEKYEAWEPPFLRSDELRVHVEVSTVPVIDWHPGMGTVRPPIDSLLYADSLVLEDPALAAIADFRGRTRGIAHWSLVRRAIACSVDMWTACRPLLLDGSVIVAPPLTTQPESSLGSHVLPSNLLVQLEATWREYVELATVEIGELITALTDLAAVVKQPVRRALRAQVAILVQQRGVHLRRRAVHEPLGAQLFQHSLALGLRQRPGRRRPRSPGFGSGGLRRR